MSGPVEKRRGFFSRWLGGGDDRAPAGPAGPGKDGAPAENEAAPARDTAASARLEPAPAAEAPPQPPVKRSPVVVIEAPPDPPAAATGDDNGRARQGWFGRLKAGLAKTSSRLTDGITGLFTKRRLTADTLDDLEDVLLQADLGIETTERIIRTLAQERFAKGISADDVRAVLAEEVERVLAPVAKPLTVTSGRKPHVVLVVGVNGTGKTTTIGKLANQLGRAGKSVMLAAGDTFRAAAIDQLKIWGERTGASVIARGVGADAAGLAYDALTAAQAAAADVLLIDTAGRLQNKQALMDELGKVVRVLRKVDPTAPHDVLLVLDATTGQNAIAQVEAFKEKAQVTGLVMTKLDGTARGGILVAIAARFGLPVHAIGVGEQADDLQPFDAREFARAIAQS